MSHSENGCIFHLDAETVGALLEALGVQRRLRLVAESELAEELEGRCEDVAREAPASTPGHETPLEESRRHEKGWREQAQESMRRLEELRAERDKQLVVSRLERDKAESDVVRLRAERDHERHQHAKACQEITKLETELQDARAQGHAQDEELVASYMERVDLLEKVLDEVRAELFRAVDGRLGNLSPREVAVELVAKIDKLRERDRVDAGLPRVRSDPLATPTPSPSWGLRPEGSSPAVSGG